MPDQSLIATHLGRSSAYPERYDPGLLVGIPRSYNRESLGLNADRRGMEGFDLWNAYEASALCDDGLPVVGCLQLRYDALSPRLVESKSLKLYLNSLNQERLGPTEAAVQAALAARLRGDLEPVLGVVPEVYWEASPRPGPHPWAAVPLLEQTVPCALDQPWSWAAASAGGPLRLRSRLLRSRCRQTGQPDWGDVYLALEAEAWPEPRGLLAHLVSLRTEMHFHEEIVEALFARLRQAPGFRAVLVAAQYTRRGGIDINPLRQAGGWSAPMLPPFDLGGMVRTERQ